MISLALFADRSVGAIILRFIVENFADDLRLLVVTNSESEVLAAEKDLVAARGAKTWVTCVESTESTQSISQMLQQHKIDLGVLCWWPKIIKPPVLSAVNRCFMNFHPSLLPYNRGSDYNFWTIVEETPFGVTLHKVDESIDGGEIVFQKEIQKTWEDNGETLYHKAREALIELFQKSYFKIRKFEFQSKPQLKTSSPVHFRKELRIASKIDLDKQYTARELLNVLRAKTFSGNPSCWFVDDGVEYEVKISITKK